MIDRFLYEYCSAMLLCNSVTFFMFDKGYFRVNYDEENWGLLTRQLKTNSLIIPPLSRAQLIDDAFSLAVDNKLGFRNVLDLMLYLDIEEDPIPLTAALRNFRGIYSVYNDSLRSNESDKFKVNI